MAGTKPFALRARVILPLSQPAIEDGAVFVFKGRIAAVGTFEQLERESAAFRRLSQAAGSEEVG